MASSIVSRGTRELSRRLHTNCVNAAGYQINYDQLREGQKREVPPSTVQANVKNVVGWRGGAERGFLATYPNCIHVLTHEVTAESPSMATWYRKVINSRIVIIQFLSPKNSFYMNSSTNDYLMHPLIPGLDQKLKIRHYQNALRDIGSHHIQTVESFSFEGGNGVRSRTGLVRRVNQSRGYRYHRHHKYWPGQSLWPSQEPNPLGRTAEFGKQGFQWCTFDWTWSVRFTEALFWKFRVTVFRTHCYSTKKSSSGQNFGLQFNELRGGKKS